MSHHQDDGDSKEERPRWLHIQMNTFKNWLNEQLHPVGSHIDDLETDLSDGILLIQSVELLQKRECTGKIYRNNPTEIQKLMNVQMALDSLRRDGIKMVNIGSHDIVEGNLKLILGVVWSLVQRYQIASRTKMPPKKLMMAWIQSVLPELKLTNFRTNWNDGKALSALLEYCQPGLCPEWRALNTRDGLNNCERALNLAEKYLGIPSIISAADLNSPELDELSCITYLSYFTKKDATGYRSTMSRVQQLLNDPSISDFSGSWCDGYLMCLLVEAVGGEVSELPSMEYDNYSNWVYNIKCGLDAAAEIGVGSLVGAEDIADSQGEHLGIMALAAALCSVGPTPSFPTTQCFENQQVNLDLAFADGSEVRTDELNVEVLGPLGDVLSGEELSLRKSRTAKGAVLSLIPTQTGYHQIRILCQGVELPSSPVSLQVLSTTTGTEKPDRLSPPQREPIRRVLSAARKASPDPEVAIENQSFAQRRAQIVKKLEEQQASALRFERKQTNETQVPHDKPPKEPFGEQQRTHTQDGTENRDPLGHRKQNSKDHIASDRNKDDIRHSSRDAREAIDSREQRGRTLYHEETVTIREETVLRESRPISSEHSRAEVARAKMGRTKSDVGLVSFSGLSAVGSLVEVVINAHGEADAGEVVLEAVSPSGNIFHCPVRHEGHSFNGTFTPEEVGPWKIGILYDGSHITGSPFNCQVFDSNLVSVYGLDVGLVGQELKFSVNASQAGQGDIKVSVLRHGHAVQTSVDEQGRTQVYTVTFIPDGAGQYKIHVLFNNMEVKGSPFLLDIADASSVSVYGENLRMASVDKAAHFMIHAIGAEPKDITVSITAPSGKTKYGRIYPVEDGSFRVEWKPVEAGEHSIDVRLYEQCVYESPFVCNVGDPELVSVRGMPRRIYAKDLNTDHSFEIDASAAGSGNLEIMINGGRVPCRVRELGSRQYLALFTPTQAVTHVVEMRFNGESVRGSPWKLEVETGSAGRGHDADKTMSYYSELSGTGLVRAPVGKSASFDISGDGLEMSDIQAKIYGPDGREFPLKVTSRGSGKFTAEYTIEKVGEHQLTVWIAGRKVDGSPLSVAGYSADKVRLEPLGGGTPGQPVQFVVDAVEAGKGQLEISVNQGRVPNNVQMQGAGRCLVTFIPQHAGTYVIDVTFNGEPVHGCPIKVEILPKQIGQPVAAPLTPSYSPATSPTYSTTHNTGIAGGYARGGPTSPTSPTLLRQARHRSADTSGEQLRSPTLLKNIDQARSRFERFDAAGEGRRSPKPWEKSMAPSGRISQSFSPSRDTRTYTETTTTTFPEKSPKAAPTREHPVAYTETTTTTTYRAESPAASPPPPSSASPLPAGILRRSESPKSSFLEAGAPTTPRRGSGQYMESTFYRDASPPVAPPAEKVKRIEQIDPLAEERQRELPEYHDKNRVGYTVAQYGAPGIVEKLPESPEADYTTDESKTRFFGDTVRERVDVPRGDRSSEKPPLPRTEPPSEQPAERAPRAFVESTLRETGRAESPIYSSVYEKFERKEEPGRGFATSTPHVERQRPATPPRDFDESSIQKSPEDKEKTPFYKSYTMEEKHYRGMSPPRYEEDRKVAERHGGMIVDEVRTEKMVSPGEGISTYAGYDQPDYTETTTTRVTSYSVSPREVSDHAATDYETKSGTLTKTKSEKIPHVEYPQGTVPDESFLRTQSEIIKDAAAPSGLRRSEEKESIYDIPPESFDKLNKASDMRPTDLTEAQRRTTEYTKYSQPTQSHTLAPPLTKKEPSIELSEPEPVGGLSDVVEVVHDKPSTDRPFVPPTPLQAEDQPKTHPPSNNLASLHPATELPQTPCPSQPTTPKMTPKGTLKGKKDKEGKAFEFGKSKFSSRHEVVRRGKDVEVKLDNLKIGKEDTLRVVVVPPVRSLPSGEQPAEVETKVKKSGNKYEISFKPSEVGTHKVFAYVNDIQHPLSPFPIRVYDASEIIVGDIPNQSKLNDTVEFTVDAGRAGFGNLEMAIKDADGVIIPSHVAQLETGSAKFLVTFTPATKGTHTVNITFNKEVLKNSPFEVHITDAEATGIAGAVGTPELTKKDLKREKEEKKKEEKERLKREKEEKAATLKREKDLKKAGKKGVVPSSPLTKTAVTKIPSLSRVGQPSHVVINVAGNDQLEINVTKSSPDGAKNAVHTEVVELEPGVMQITFVPDSVGDHEIEVKYAGQHVSGSPFTCRAYDPARIHVGTIPSGVIDKPVHFVVDASEAGVGNLEVAVNDGRIPSMAHALGQHRYDISFVPRESQDHTITVRFNNEPVPGSPFMCKLVSATQVTAAGPGLERVSVGEPSEITITSSGEEAPQVVVRDAQGVEIPAEVIPAGNNGYTVRYTPRCVGNHMVEVSYMGEPIAGSPFTAKAYDSNMVKLTPCEGAVVGKPCTFSIDAARAGAGNMEIIVSVDGRNVPNFVQAEGQARFKVSFTPQESREHVISVRFNGQSIPGSPMKCQVSPATEITEYELSKASQLTEAPLHVEKEKTRPQTHGEKMIAQVGQKKGFAIDNAGKSGDCNVIVTDSRGGPLSVRCYKQQDDSYWVEFTPEQTGEHTIEITFGEIPVPGSPFKCNVVDPKKVVVKGLQDGLTLRHAATVAVNRRDAGTSDLSVEVTDPSGRPLKVEMIKSPSGEDRATFLPVQLGAHKVNVKAAGFPLPGYPQVINVEEVALPTVYGAAVDQSVKVGEPASLIFDPKKANGGLKIDVRGPNKEKIRHNTMRRPNGTSEVVFYPEEVGTYSVNIHFNNKAVSGTPVDVRVVDPSKVLVNDEAIDRDGHLSLQLNQRNVFDVDATAAGPGKLRAEVRDADNVLLSGGPAVEDLGYGKWRLTFEPRTPARYAIYLYWNEFPVDSAYPIRVNVSSMGASAGPSHSKYDYAPQTAAATSQPQHFKQRSGASTTSHEDETSDHLRIILRGDGLRRAQLKEPNEFIVDGSEVPRDGRLTATLIGQKADIPVKVQQLGHNVFKSTYTPAIGGNYELHVLWNGRHVKGSPFPVSVAFGNTVADMISVDTSTLKIGIINEDIKTLIDTRRAGPGQLSAQCMGPMKLTYCELYNHRDGTYTLSIRPTEVGKHTLTIKFNDEHVPGSPFLIHVSMPPDPSKVRVYGPGIEHGILSTFKSNFVVETKGAGAGQLTVRVRGPKGAFNVEMQREKRNERTIHCKYEPKEPGDYQVEVKWHGEHVPGSPFLVMIVDTEQELARFLRGDAPSPTPVTPFTPPGWIGPPPPPIYPAGSRGPAVLPIRGAGAPYGPMVPPPGAIMPPYGGPPLQSRGKKYANGY